MPEPKNRIQAPSLPGRGFFYSSLPCHSHGKSFFQPSRYGARCTGDSCRPECTYPARTDVLCVAKKHELLPAPILRVCGNGGRRVSQLARHFRCQRTGIVIGAVSGCRITTRRLVSPARPASSRRIVAVKPRIKLCNRIGPRRHIVVAQCSPCTEKTAFGVLAVKPQRCKKGVCAGEVCRR